MFEINYRFSNSNYLSSANPDESTLRYSLFLGDVILKDEKSAISMDWDWIPILDFAICMIAIYNNLFEKESSIEEFEFTESNEKLIFRKKGN